MTESKQNVSADGISRLTVDLAGADVLVRWVEGIHDLSIAGANLPVERVGDEVYIRDDLSRRRSEDDDDAELRISGFESPGQAVEEILLRTGFFTGRGRHSRKGPPVTLDVPTFISKTALEVNRGSLTLENPHGSVECKLKRGEFISRGGNAELDVAAGSGGVDITGLVGSVRAAGGSGDISLTDVHAIVNIKAGSGEIALNRVQGEAIKLTAGSGDIVVRESRAGSYSSDCGSGDVTIDSGALDRISVRTGSGDVSCTARFGAYGQSFVTGSGTLSLGVPRDVSARIEAFTSGGDIDSELQLVSVGQRGPKSRRSRRQVGSIGTGEPRAEVSLRTSSGDIHIHWLQPSQGTVIPMPPPVPVVPNPPEPPTPPDPSSAEQSPAEPQERDAPEQGGSAHDDEWRAILESLANGEISVEEADALLDSLEERKSNR